MEREISVIGGGTGISNLLRAFKYHFEKLNAIVAMTDDGGSSGLLRSELSILPPGDVRNCLVALSETEPIMEALLQHRFQAGSISGQNVGNLLIAALIDICGSFDKALLQLENVFKIKGHIYPVTLDDTHIVAELASGDRVMGESIIPNICHRLDTSIKKIYCFPKTPKANEMAIDAIKRSDVIVIGPGSLYTSIIPNLLTEGIIDAIKISNAKKIFIVNAMSERGETDNFTVSDHVNAIRAHSFSEIIDTIFVNDYLPDEEILSEYKNKGSLPVKFTKEDEKTLSKLDIEIIKGKFIESSGGEIRHDGRTIAKYLKRLKT